MYLNFEMSAVRCKNGGVWWYNVMLTYISFIASYENLWVIQDQHAINAIQVIWDAIYSWRIWYTVEFHIPVFIIVGPFFFWIHDMN